MAPPTQHVEAAATATVPAVNGTGNGVEATEKAGEPKKKPLSFAKKVLAKQNSVTTIEHNRPKVSYP